MDPGTVVPWLVHPYFFDTLGNSETYQKPAKRRKKRASAASQVQHSNSYEYEYCTYGTVRLVILSRGKTYYCRTPGTWYRTVALFVPYGTTVPAVIGPADLEWADRFIFFEQYGTVVG